MQQKAAHSPAFPHRPVAVSARPPATQRQFTRVLNDHHITAGTRKAVRAAAVADISAAVTLGLRKTA